MLPTLKTQGYSKIQHLSKCALQTSRHITWELAKNAVSRDPPHTSPESEALTMGPRNLSCNKHSEDADALVLLYKAQHDLGHILHHSYQHPLPQETTSPLASAPALCICPVSVPPHLSASLLLNIFVARLTCSKRMTPKPTESEYRGALKNCEHPRAQLVLRGPNS